MTDKDTTESGVTRVGHCKADETDVYVGRGNGGAHIHTSEIGERGWLGNPYTVDDYSRDHSIAEFRDDFEHRLEHDSEFRDAIRELAGETLGCWCQRLDEDSPACHAEVIAEHADRLDGEKLITDGGAKSDGTEQQYPNGPSELDAYSLYDLADTGVGEELWIPVSMIRGNRLRAVKVRVLDRISVNNFEEHNATEPWPQSDRLPTSHEVAEGYGCNIDTGVDR